MEKLKMQTADLTEKNIDKIAQIFPNVITESQDENGKPTKAIDFNLLKQELSDILVEEGEERYRLDWPGKKASILKANTPIKEKTLRPVVKESVDFENTENLFIEGDNFEVLKLLQESYLNKVKLIYIDPPYNTGKDFVYKDNFTQAKEEYDEEIGTTDSEGNKLFKNTETNGRFHSDWLSMMYERLVISKDLLRDDGVIFASIDSSEVANLKRICDEIFGEENLISQICRATGTTTGQDAAKFGSSLDYLLVYRKSDKFFPQGLPLTEKDKNRFRWDDNDGKGKYALLQLRKTGTNDRKEDRPNMFYEIKDPEGGDVWPIGPTDYLSCWRVERKSYQKLIEDNLVVWLEKELEQDEDDLEFEEKDDSAVEKEATVDNNNIRRSKWVPYVKYYLEGRTKRPSNLWNDIEGNKKGSLQIKELFGKKVFTNPKPLELLTRIINISEEDANGIVLDFFAGSATTAHAVMQLNTEEGGDRKFIMVQLPEETDKDSEAYKAGYKTIADIGKERIRRAAKKVKEDNNDKDLLRVDFGFRVYKTDSTNMKDVYYNPNKLNQDLLSGLESNIKEDRNAEDLLTQVILDLGLELSLKIETKEISGNTVFFVADNSLVACFDQKINNDIVDEIAKCSPLKVVFRDAGFTDDKDRINVEERFKRLSPETKVRVI